MPWRGSKGADWADAAAALREVGWLRLPGVVESSTRTALADAAPSTWAPLPEVEGRVRQGGLSCGLFLDDAPAPVRHFAQQVRERLTASLPDQPPLPGFNEVRWGRSHQGTGFITAHRDPPGAGGVIAVVTIFGRARFRVWDGADSTEWETDDGDLVLLRGRGWPTDDAQCPVHEVESPRVGERMTITLRHNLGGPGADYFARHP